LWLIFSTLSFVGLGEDPQVLAHAPDLFEVSFEVPIYICLINFAAYCTLSGCFVWPDLAQVAASKQLLRKSMSEPEGCFEISGMSVWDSLEYEREPDYKIFESYGYDGHRCSGGPCQFQMSNLSITSQFPAVPGWCLVTCYHSDLSRFFPTTSNPEQSSATLTSFTMKDPRLCPTFSLQVNVTAASSTIAQ
jgi:hypothetical protein